MTRTGVDRILKFAFDLASRSEKHLASATVERHSITMPYWDERVEAMAKKYPGEMGQVPHRLLPRTSCCIRLVRRRVSSNLFGDILSDLGPACTGTIGIAPSATSIRKAISPRCSSRCTVAPIAGQGIANPIGMICRVR